MWNVLSLFWVQSKHSRNLVDLKWLILSARSIYRYHTSTHFVLHHKWMENTITTLTQSSTKNGKWMELIQSAYILGQCDRHFSSRISICIFLNYLRQHSINALMLRNTALICTKSLKPCPRIIATEWNCNKRTDQ